MNHRRLVSAVAATLVLVGTGAVPAAADPSEQPGPDEAPAFSVSVSPPRLTLTPDDLDQPHEVRVTNRGQRPAEVTLRKRDMSAAPGGGVRFPVTAPYSATDWVRATPERFQLAPGERQMVTLHIDVPPDYEPGDHHVGLVFVVPSGDQDATVRVNRGIGIPVYIQAPGPVDRSVALTGFDGPGFAISGPVTFTADLHHTGTVHRAFTGDDQLRIDLDGEQLALPEFHLMRGASRQVAVDWSDAPLFCVCRATLAVPAEPGGPAVPQEVTVVIIPLHLIGLLLGLVLVTAIVVLVRRRTAVR